MDTVSQVCGAMCDRELGGILGMERRSLGTLLWSPVL